MSEALGLGLEHRFHSCDFLLYDRLLLGSEIRVLICEREGGKVIYIYIYTHIYMCMHDTYIKGEGGERDRHMHSRNLLLYDGLLQGSGFRV